MTSYLTLGISVEKKQKEHVLTELSSQHIIAKPVVATSGCAFTIGEVGSPNMRRLPPRLPPIHQKNNRKTIDRQTIESNLKKAEKASRQCEIVIEYYNN